MWRHAQSDTQRKLLLEALTALRDDCAERPQDPVLCIRLPLHTWAATGAPVAGGFPLAAATTLLYAGIDLLDDLADGDLHPRWTVFRPSEVHLAATTMMCCLPALALETLDVTPARRETLLQTMARHLLTMSAGQQADLRLQRSEAPLGRDVEAAVAAKSGEELALYATLGALAAGASPDRADAFAEYGRWLGQAGQLASDCHDLFEDAYSRDLANGTRTLPIVLYLERLEGEARAQFLCLLARAAQDSDAAAEVRTRLRANGVLRRCAFLVEIHGMRALQALHRAAPQEPARTWLEALVRGLSFVRRPAPRLDPPR